LPQDSCGTTVGIAATANHVHGQLPCCCAHQAARLPDC
jgi:hypothetical protein